MARKRNVYPVLRKRFNYGAWHIYWYFGKKQYSIATGFTDENNCNLLEVTLRQLSSELANEVIPQNIPSPYDAMPGMVRYLSDRYGHEEIKEDLLKLTNDELVKIYIEKVKLEISKGWLETVYKYLEDLANFKKLTKFTKNDAENFLTNILKENKKPATRNRVFSVCLKFFNWALKNGFVKDNPFQGIGRLKEERNLHIVYCTKDDRERIVDAARKTKRSDWLAVPIALYAGLRRGELYNLRWEDIKNNLIVIKKSKTGIPRTTPIAPTLKKIFDKIPAEERKGYIAKPPFESKERILHSENLIEELRIQLCRSVSYNDNGTANGAIGKKLFSMTEEDLALPPPAYAPNIAADGLDFLPAEKINWNSFRHSFASLLAQQNVSLDKISAWMGNSPEVCRRHYTQFVPIEHNDIDFLKMG